MTPHWLPGMVEVPLILADALEMRARSVGISAEDVVLNLLEQYLATHENDEEDDDVQPRSS